MMKRKTGLLSAILLAALLPFCGGKSETSGSSESHFLEPCGAGCKGGFDCICGVCTQPCTAGTACGDLGVASAVCTAGCEEDVCDVLCDRDADCDEVGEEFACDAGRCRLRPPATGCGEAEAELEAFLDGAKACSIDEDCVKVASDCYVGEHCGAAVALSADHDEAEWARLSSRLEECRTPDGVDCTVCLGEVPAARCSAGTCTLGGAPQLTCDERDAEATAAVRAAVDSAATSCAADGDCVAVGLSSMCNMSCTAIVSETGAAAVRAVIQELNTGLCETYVSDGCPIAEVICLDPGIPVCVDGQCVGRPEAAPGVCGDGMCDAQESAAACASDCGFCGDGQCSASEDQWSCPTDCGWCGDGTCDSGETAATCPADCTPG